MSAFLSMLVTAILNWVAGFIGKEVKDIEAKEASEAVVAAAATQQKAATSPEQIDAASKTISSDF